MISPWKQRLMRENDMIRDYTDTRRGRDDFNMFSSYETQQPGSYKIQGSLLLQLARGRHLAAPKGLSPTCEKTIDTNYTIKTAKNYCEIRYYSSQFISESI